MKNMALDAASGYSIRDIINYRSIPWSSSEDFLIITDVPSRFEPFFIEPDYYCFGLITEGKLEIRIDDHLYDLSPTSLMVYRPGQQFKIHNITKGTKGTFILFTRKFLNYLDENIFSIKNYSFLSYGIQAVIELSQKDKDELVAIFNEIFGLLQHPPRNYWEPIARNLASVLIYETDNILKDYISPNATYQNEHNALFTRFSNLVGQHFHAHRKLSFYASLLFVSHDHLYTVVKKIAGTNPTALIHQRVIKEASFLLATSTDNVSEIAYRLNFSDPFAFSKFFKKHSGLAPSQFRQQQLRHEF